MVSQDDLVDIHVGNPLHKITKLLEDIKKQKAFSFTLKGSLGVMGVFLTLSVFGVLGGGHLLCDKGIQTQVGEIRTLHALDTDEAVIPVLSGFLDYFMPRGQHSRVVLVKEDDVVVRIPYHRNVSLKEFEGEKVFVTGKYDACSQTISIKDLNSIEKL